MALPPGLSYYDGPLVETANGGVSDWVEYKNVKAYTNAFVIVDDTKVLLGLKKRGFGRGLWNGFGGKVDLGETPLQAAVRELEEEAGITAPLEQCGTLFFAVDGVEAAFNIDVFRAHEYTGTITESDEMRPQWFSIQGDLLPPSKPSATLDRAPQEGIAALPPIPLEQMWADDEFWLPLMFARRYFVGRADFSADNKMLKWWFGAAPPPS
ncbi:NUDIX hydrolase domain-like protein [Dichomitus squalens]|uniref:Oxidized purine nucleoside triphosphate hydrolase n=1 Tax=Dichomitus squalens TaxID=114155 RepID=A0A4Q9NTX2_9APHY|nr:NUDIX hydrolase domain-like protein [Dichomitus squalens]TBU45159.1 NUDIX hydrolase domain-like protein [Dichomitus squalens]